MPQAKRQSSSSRAKAAEKPDAAEKASEKQAEAAESAPQSEGTKLKAPGSKGAQSPQVFDAPQNTEVPDPPAQDGAEIPDSKAVVCPVCQYRFDPKAEQDS